MFSSVEGRRRRRLPWRVPLGLLLGLLSGLLPGCFRSGVRGPEVCNFDDDDGDRRIDEGFVDAEGLYSSPEACGGCSVVCAEVFPTAAATDCVVEDDVSGERVARCVLVRCPAGTHRVGIGCEPDLPSLCLPCAADDDCALREEGARCVTLAGASGDDDRRCLPPCGPACPSGFSCSDGVCAPDGGTCACTEDTRDVDFACLRATDNTMACAGVRRCEEGPSGLGLGACRPALDEACNLRDDDCDGAIDEAFRDDAGRYVDEAHCGACDVPCVAPGPNQSARCVAAGPGATCEVECLEGFVDVDGFQANGCECERADGGGPPPVVGGDADCDGLADDDDAFVYVTPTGNDADPGTLARPRRTPQGAIARGVETGRDVLVARGIYDGAVTLRGGVSVFGGYRPDFRDRDIDLFPVVLEHTAAPGSPVLRCTAAAGALRLEGMTIRGSDATDVGGGSTALFSDGCGPEVTFAELTLEAGRGAPGRRGDASSDALDPGLTLRDLDGSDGTAGAEGQGREPACRRIAAGRGGALRCPDGVDVGGGDGGDGDCPESGCRNGLPCGNGGCTDFTEAGVCDFAAVLAAAVPNPSAEPGRGPAGGAAGERTFNAPTNRGVCNFCDDGPTLPRDGGDGGDGTRGDDGEGGPGCALTHVLDPSGRVRGGDGAGGSAGGDGSGGGG
ncbi:MAG: hypothetical protein AAF447_27915, partial [Myxococcota bacterium]